MARNLALFFTFCATVRYVETSLCQHASWPQALWTGLRGALALTLVAAYVRWVQRPLSPKELRAEAAPAGPGLFSTKLVRRFAWSRAAEPPHDRLLDRQAH